MAGRVMFGGIGLCRESAQQLKSFQIVCRPFCLDFDHGLQGLGRECVSGSVEGQRDAATIAVAIDVMGAGSAVEGEAVAHKSRNHFPGSQAAKSPVIDRHVFRRLLRLEVRR
jgi:hypothetical protein